MPIHSCQQTANIVPPPVAYWVSKWETHRITQPRLLRKEILGMVTLSSRSLRTPAVYKLHQSISTLANTFDYIRKHYIEIYLLYDTSWLLMCIYVLVNSRLNNVLFSNWQTGHLGAITLTLTAFNVTLTVDLNLNRYVWCSIVKSVNWHWTGFTT